MKKFAGTLAAIVAFFSILTSLYMYDSKLAKKYELFAVELRLDQKIIRDDAFYLQREIWKIENQYGTDCLKMPPDVRDRYRKMQYDLKHLEQQLDRLTRKKSNS